MKYEQPIMEIQTIDDMDVIRTSPLEDEGTGNGAVKGFGDTGW